MNPTLHLGDCLEVLKSFPDEYVDLIYLDPPFFTQKIQILGTRDRRNSFSFNDIWKSEETYGEFLFERLKEMWRVLRATGSIFFHCDNNAAPIARLILDNLFGPEMFRAEIIWYYRRWSNSQRTLLPCHQNIYFYSKTNRYKFNHLLGDYSSSTNVDQILQKRRRDTFGKAVYARDENGKPLSNGEKRGVPLGDVWDIPFLNPKAKERVGYPTQKPILLLERIIEISTDQEDMVLDPFCGSGSTLVAAKLLNRKGIGIDISAEAIGITKDRLANPTKTESHLMRVGRESYRTADTDALALLKGLDIIPVQRNRGIDAFVKTGNNLDPIPIRVQRPNETIGEAANALHRACRSKTVATMVLVATGTGLGLEAEHSFPEIVIVSSLALTINKLLSELKIYAQPLRMASRYGSSG